MMNLKFYQAILEKIGQQKAGNMKKTTIKDVKILNFKKFKETNGTLVPIEFNKSIPFEVKRTFHVSGVNDADVRGQHAHYKTELVLVCVSGKIKAFCDDGIERKKIILDDPSLGLYIPSMIWDEQIYCTKDTTLLAFASTNYTIDDYIVDYDKFKKLKLGYEI